jgi:predicted molibdopterin-dependent oxidoreductase YjgC
MMIDTRDGVVVRLRPRPNLEVNRHFMCDVGRADYRWMNRGDRAEVPLGREQGRLHPLDWDRAIAKFAELIRGSSGSAVLLASGRASTESLGWVSQLVRARDLTAAIQVPLGEEAPLPGVPNLALRKERAGNLEGGRLAGYTAAWNDAVSRLDGAGLVILLDVQLTEAETQRLARAGTVILLQTVDADPSGRAALVLPITAMPEENGTYVNRDKRVQRFTQAKAAPGMARPAWWIAAEACAVLEPGRATPDTAADAFAGLGSFLPALAGLSYADLGLTGRLLDAPRAELAAR